MEDRDSRAWSSAFAGLGRDDAPALRDQLTLEVDHAGERELVTLPALELESEIEVEIEIELAVADNDRTVDAARSFDVRHAATARRRRQADVTPLPS
ncbi:MAG TPA: hypothetical protein VFQ53_19305 [Kofleriaceae bacterium]|nr:hypothetical protein [Kofleriaceae bacterium]